jgi:branched-chain amino acid transport system substrate-binding protein
MSAQTPTSDHTGGNAMTARTSRSTAWSLGCLAASGLLVLTACGTRLSNARIDAAARPIITTGVGVQAGNGTGAGSGQGANNGSAAGVGSTPLPGSTGGATLAPGGLTTGGAAAGTGAASGGAGTHGSGTGGGKGTGGGTGTGGGSGLGAASAGAACTRSLTPVVLGQNGAFSGIVGQSTANLRTGLSVWAKWVNANGGVQCHPVQLYQEDDGSDPSKASANVNDLAANKHAVAILGVDDPIAIAANISAAEQNKVPIIGGDLSSPDWNNNPLVFPVGGSSMQVYSGSFIKVAALNHLTKFGVVYCVEASICTLIGQQFKSLVARANGSVVYDQSTSITQSDYTAECQNAKNAGVQLLFVAADGSTAQRLINSCKSINYQPKLVTPGIAGGATAIADPNLKAAGYYIGTNEIPYAATGTAALNLFHNAFKQYSGTDASDQSAMKGWVAGMMFKAAIDNLGAAARQGPITTAMVLQGLRSLRSQSLGGLVPGMSYPSSGAPVVNCFGVLADTNRGIVSLTGSSLTCG